MQATHWFKRAWLLLRAPLIGLALGLLLLKAYGHWQIWRMTPLERSRAARAHCEQAQNIQDEACRRLKLSPIYLPPQVLSEMIDEYSRALEIDPDNLEALHSRAYWKWFNHDAKGARADYDALLVLKPDLSLAWYQRGRLRSETGDPKGAIEDYTKSLDLEPHRPGSAVISARACSRMETGDYRGALADYHEDMDGKEFLPGDYRLFPVGKCHQALGEHAKAVAAFDLYLEKTDSAAARYARGLSHFKLGDRKNAFTDFQRAFKDDGEERRNAEAFIKKFPEDLLSALLNEALIRQPESE